MFKSLISNLKTTVTMDEEKELEEFRLGTYVEQLQNAIGVMLDMIPAEPSAEDSRILRALHGINEVKSYLEVELHKYEKK